jgi:hypothetical protein
MLAIYIVVRAVQGSHSEKIQEFVTRLGLDLVGGVRPSWKRIYQPIKQRFEAMHSHYHR